MKIKPYNQCYHCGKYISKFAWWKGYCVKCGLPCNELQNMIRYYEKKYDL